MSGRSYDSYLGSLSHYTNKSLDDTELKVRRVERITKTKKDLTIMTDDALRSVKVTEVKREEIGIYDINSVRSQITTPKPETKRIHIVIIDNSGSNRVIASHFRESSGYFTSVLNSLDPTSQIAFMYYSDHCDGRHINQEIDYISPDEEGDKIIHSTTRNIVPASGGDSAEAFECALHEVCDKDFGNAEFKHLYLVTDEVAHGMGETDDNGCPYQRNWRDSVERVYNTFSTFEVVGCGNARISKLQAQFLKPERVGFDLMDLSKIPEETHRKAIAGNSLLFLIARKTGLQTLELFLSFLYEKWLEEPIFGKSSDTRAKEMIERFGKYIEADEQKVMEILNKVII
jgi:hypothetical protein